MSETRISISPSQLLRHPDTRPIGTPISKAAPTARQAMVRVMREPNSTRL